MKHLLIVGLLLTGCTGAERSHFKQLGLPREITCYSGNLVIYHGFSTGKVIKAFTGAGYYFTERDSGQLIEVVANCVMKAVKAKK